MEFTCYTNGPYSTNTYLVYEPGTADGFVIDPATPYKPLFEGLKSRGIDLKYIILTHGHSDHTGGIEKLKELYPDVKVAASVKEHDFLASRKMTFARGPVYADIEVEDGEEMDIGPLHLKFISTPGHTPGGQCVLIGKWLFSGDTLFFGSVGRTDLWGGDFDTEMRSIREKLLVLGDDVKVFPGHGPATTIAFEKENNPFV